jgi:hypothetical protein
MAFLFILVSENHRSKLPSSSPALFFFPPFSHKEKGQDVIMSSASFASAERRGVLVVSERTAILFEPNLISVILPSPHLGHTYPPS